MNQPRLIMTDLSFFSVDGSVLVTDIVVLFRPALLIWYGERLGMDQVAFLLHQETRCVHMNERSGNPSYFSSVVGGVFKKS